MPTTYSNIASLKNFRSLERTMKGCANHRRIEIIQALYKHPEMSVSDLAIDLKINFKTASEHIRRLAIAGLILKRSEGASVRHCLTSKGRSILKFLRTLE